MIVKIEHVWNGRTHSFRITTPKGERESIEDRGGWDRVTARKVLDMLEFVYKYKRRNVRFEVF